MSYSFGNNIIFRLQTQRLIATTLMAVPRLKGNEKERDILKKQPIGNQNFQANHTRKNNENYKAN